jgi:hypothetical protein
MLQLLATIEEGGHMPTYQDRIPAATAIVGYDLFTGQIWSRTPQPRALLSFGMVGSAALGDTEVDLLIGEIRIGNFFNSRTGVTSPNIEDIIQLGGLGIPGGALLRGIVRDAATTNPVAFIITFADIRRRG